MDIKTLENLIKRGEAIGSFLMGFCYENGYGVDGDQEKAIQLYKQAADEGLHIACYAYANLVLDKDDADNKVEGVSYCRLAAEQGLAEAQDTLGLIYENGIGIDRDMKIAIDWYTKAANNSYSNSAYHLGYLLENGIGGEEDIEKAISWYQKAAELGDANAAYILAELYRKGIKTHKDEKLSFYWYEQASKLGSSLANSFLAVVFKDGLLSKEPDPVKVKQYIKKMEACRMKEMNRSESHRNKIID